MARMLNQQLSRKYVLNTSQPLEVAHEKRVDKNYFKRPPRMASKTPKLEKSVLHQYL